MTPFQPGASPLAPLPPIAAGLAGLVLLGQALYDALKPREKQGDPPPWNEGSLQEVVFPGGATVRVDYGWVVTGSATNCTTGVSRTFTVGPVNRSLQSTGVGRVRLIDTGNQVRSGGCPDGFGISGAFGSVVFLDTNGNPFTGDGPIFNGSIGTGTESGSLTLRMPVTVTNVTTGQQILRPAPPAPDPPQSVLPAAVPALPPAEEGAPEPERILPIPVPVPLPVPGSVPAPAPAPSPGGLPRPAPAPAPGTAPRVTPAPGPSTPPALPQATPITAGGVQPLLPPAPAITPTDTTFLPGGRPLVGNGPPPTMQGVVTELGKLEQKLEILLKPDDPLSPLELLNKVIDQVENIQFLLETLFPPGPYTYDAGQYQLTPVCDRDSEGNLLPARVVSWPGGEGEFAELKVRLDALAVLLQHHKDLKQPTCGGNATGPHGNVTVHFESD